MSTLVLFLRDTNSYLHKFRRTRRKTANDYADTMVTTRFKSSTSRLLSLTVKHLTHWWGCFISTGFFCIICVMREFIFVLYKNFLKLQASVGFTIQKKKMLNGKLWQYYDKLVFLIDSDHRYNYEVAVL